MNFRHLLEQNDLGAALFAKVGELLLANRSKLSGGTIVDATIIAAPGSTKNAGKTRDPEMHQTKKGNQWYFVLCALRIPLHGTIGFADVLRRLRLLVA